MNWFVISGSLSFLANLVIGLFVFLKNPKKSLNIYFALFSLTVSGWSFGSFLENIIPDKDIALTVLRWNYFFGMWLPTAYLLFVYTLVGTPLRQRINKLRISFFLSIVLSVLVFTPWFITGLRKIPTTNFFISVPGPLYYVFFVFFAVGMIEVISYTTFRLSKFSGNKKTQIKYMTIANAVAILGGFEYFSRVFGFFESPPLDDYLLVIYFAIVAYSIVRHQLLDIEVIIKKTLVFAGLFGMIISIVGVVTILIQEIIGRYLQVNNWVSTSLSVSVAIIFYDPTRKALVRLTDKFLFQKKEDIRLALKRMTEEIVTILDLEQLGKTILSTLVSSLRLESGFLIVKDEKENQYRVLESLGEIPSTTTFTVEDSLIQYFQDHKGFLNFEASTEVLAIPAEIRDRLLAYKVRIALPLFLSEDLIGILILGKKKSDEEFTQEELDYLSTVAGQAAIALSNARAVAIQRRSQIEYAQQAKLAAIGTLSSGIGHEIKNPLQIIRSGVGMLQFNRKQGVFKNLSREEFETQVYETLDKIDAGVSRANSVIDRLSTFAKKPKEIRMELVDLKLAVEEVLALTESQFFERGISIQKDYQIEKPVILADLHSLEQVILNLVVNASHALKENGKITITVKNQPNEIELAIKDTGAGIAPENLEKIFDPFFTTKDTTRNPDQNAIKGTGLGLFLVRESVKQFGGRIEVESRLGAGTTFHLFFPQPKAAS